MLADTPAVQDTYIPRALTRRLVELAGPFPVVYLTGPRQSGKTTLARNAFPSFRYVSLEETLVRQEATHDPARFLRRTAAGADGVILDEAQRAPELFSYLQGFVDERRGGPFVLTGSQNFLLLESITQSLAGRAAVLELLPLSVAELERRPSLAPRDLEHSLAASPAPSRPSADVDDLMMTGLYPALHSRSLPPAPWFNGYVRTYVERDARLAGAIGDLDTFQRFVGLCAGRVGQLLNLTSLGDDAGVDRTTARRWLSILRASYIVTTLQPHFANFSRRLVKTPKLYFLDTGLVCHLLGIREVDQLRGHPLRGAIFENFVVAELTKVFANDAEAPRLHFWRDSHGAEVDVVLDFGGVRIPIEIKSGETPGRSYYRGLRVFRDLAAASGQQISDPYGILVYGGAESGDRWGHMLRPWWACS